MLSAFTESSDFYAMSNLPENSTTKAYFPLVSVMMFLPGSLLLELKNR